MSKFCRKTIFFGSCYVRTLPPTSIPGFLQNPYFFPLRLFSSNSNQQSFAVSYLIKELGFSPESALSASRYVDFHIPEKPDNVIVFLKNYGFSQTQISSLVRRYPTVLLSDVKKTILPKLDFLEAKGVSRPEIAKIISFFPGILQASLARRLMPSYDFFKDLLRSDEKVVFSIKQSGHLLTRNIEKYVAPKIDILRELGVPYTNIATLFKYEAKAFSMISLDHFRKLVNEVEEMGFDVMKVNFVVAMRVLRSMSKSKWESKVNAYKKWGWSDEEISKAFQRSPWCMGLSEDKITAALDFYSSKMGLTPSVIAKCPVVLTLSLEKRLVPRNEVPAVMIRFKNPRSMLQK
ncbi:hypothetical protein TIFTF001_054533, partial [Ficus carica]